jgi:hypothetical protein
MKKVIDEGDGYKIRATRKSVGTFEVVAVDWEHPNYGYFTDAMQGSTNSPLPNFLLRLVPLRRTFISNCYFWSKFKIILCVKINHHSA